MKERAIATVILAAMASACSHTVTVEAPRLGPVVEMADFGVVVVYDSTLRNHRCSASKGYIADEWEISLGAASIATFTPIFSAMFAHVIVLAPGDAMPADDAFVINLSLQSYTGCDVVWPITGSTVSIAYSATVMRGSDTVVDDWTGTGRVSGDEVDMSSANPFGGIEEVYLEKITSLAIRKAAADFLRKFEDDEQIRAWKAAAVTAVRE